MLLDKPKFAGVESVSGEAVTIRVTAKAAGCRNAEILRAGEGDRAGDSHASGRRRIVIAISAGATLKSARTGHHHTAQTGPLKPWRSILQA